VTIDGIDCAVTAKTGTTVTCTTGARLTLVDPTTLEIDVANMGRVATRGLRFYYGHFYSMYETWGGEFPPKDGDSILIPPGQHLIVDVDSTAWLKAVIVQGSLLFFPESDPTHERTFDAKYVMV
jgi:hypothetical protein